MSFGGVAQPDLAGMMVVRGPDETIEAAAQALLALNEIEWAFFAAIPPKPTTEPLELLGPFLRGRM